MKSQSNSVLICIMLLLSGCAGTKILSIENDINKVWPSPPDQARYKYVGQLTGEGDFKSQAQSGNRVVKALKWLVGGLLGKEKPVVLQRPQAGLVDAQGKIYVSDVNRQAVYVFDGVEGKLKIWEWAEQSKRFVAPIGLALHEQKLYVADAELGMVSILNVANGEPEGKIGKNLTRPTGLAIDAVNKKLYVADTRAHAIKVFNLTGEQSGTIGHYGDKNGELNGPTHIAYANKKLYVADTLNARIQVFNQKGQFVQSVGQRGKRVGDLTRPKGVAVDVQGHIYVVESFYDHLLVFDRKGRLLLPIGGEGRGVGQFYLPAGVWLDSTAKVYVADMFNGRVVVLKYLEGA